jgi:hypothetical protein
MKTLMLIFCLSLISVMSANAGTQCVTKKGYLAGKTIDMVVTANNFAAQDKYDSVQQMVDSGLVYVLRDRIPVYLEKTDFAKEKVKIRFKDVNLTVWTSIRAIDCH